LVGSGELMVWAPKRTAAAFCAVCACLAMCLTLCLALPGAASADSTAIYQDCNSDGVINGNYSKSDLQSALGSLPADLKQYSDCESAIQQALAGGGKHGHGGGGGNGGGRAHGGGAVIRASRAARRRIARQVEQAAAAPAGGAIQAPGGVAIKPAGGQTLASAAAPGVPAALIVAIAGLLALFGAEMASRTAARRKAPSSRTDDGGSQS